MITRARSGVVLAGLLAAACGAGGSLECIQPPCPLPLAITLEVTAAVGGAVAGAVVNLSGGARGTVPCETGAESTTCRIPGTPATYELEVSAPGFETAHRSVTVSGFTPECGCPTVVPQRLSLVLAASP